jgi:uncharacterized sulfatase
VSPGIVTGIGSELDILPTLASVTGAHAPTDRILDGYDLSPTLRGQSPSPRQILYYYANTGAGVLSAVRRGPYKAHFVVSGADASAASAPQLYNLDQDPSEKFDLAAKHADLVAELRKVADDHRATVVAVKNQIATRTAKPPQP